MGLNSGLTSCSQKPEGAVTLPYVRYNIPCLQVVTTCLVNCTPYAEECAGFANLESLIWSRMRVPSRVKESERGVPDPPTSDLQLRSSYYLFNVTHLLGTT